MRSIALVLSLLLATAALAQDAPAAAELRTLLDQFLDGASKNDHAMHERFWADDLVYTSSAGARRSKAEVMKGVRSSPMNPNPRTIYGAEDVRIRQYGDNLAVVTFKLVAGTAGSYFNSGTFVKRDDRWQAVNWQSTRIPVVHDDVKGAATAAEAAFHRALRAADTDKLLAMLDEAFVWTHEDGRPQTREQLLHSLRIGALIFTKIETSNVSLAVVGDTAVARGTSERQRKGEEPHTVYYTLTLVNRSGDWKALALHTSKP